jgi:hypothetical protein
MSEASPLEPACSVAAASFDPSREGFSAELKNEYRKKKELKKLRKRMKNVVHLRTEENFMSHLIC